MRRSLFFAVAGVAILLFSQVSVHAGSVLLSDYCSQPSVDASLLDAEVSFAIDGTTLTIDIANLTPAGDAGFNIRELYFNAASNVTGLSLDGGLTNWSLATAIKGNGFGRFDYALMGTDTKEYEIDGEETGTFTLTVSGSGVSASDFYTDLSTPVEPDDAVMILAAKFVRGPSNMSGYGATDVPEPATIVMLGPWSFGLAAKTQSVS